MCIPGREQFLFVFHPICAKALFPSSFDSVFFLFSLCRILLGVQQTASSPKSLLTSSLT